MKKNPGVDVEAVFGTKSKYRVTMDPSYEAERGTKRKVEESFWLRRIDCRGGVGHLYVHGRDLVAYSGVGMRIRASLLRIPGVQSHQTGDDEFTVVFPPKLVPKVAKVVNPRTKRTLSDTERARLVEMGARYRLGATSGAGPRPS